jgi:HAMP domain-containing protein
MLIEILLGAVVVAVAVLVAMDMSRVKSEGPHEYADGSAHDARPAVIGATRGGSTEAFIPEPAETRTPAAAYDVGPTRRAESISPSARGYEPSRIGRSAGRERSSRGLKNWHVRSRLLLLVVIPTITVTVVAFCIVRIASALHGTPTHSAILSALTVGIVVIIVVASWSTVAVARSVLKPLHRLEVGAREVTGARLSDAIRRVGETNAEGVPSDLAPVDVDSSDEIGEVARAFDQMRREVLRLAGDEATLRGRLNAIFVNLSHRSQSLVERQIRLMEGLEQGEYDSERRAGLLKMNRIANRMQRNSENLLVLAGQEPSVGWNQPVMLANVISAAVYEIEDFERVSVSVQPEVAVRGPAVNDAVHLLAELIENATSFSAVDMRVDISGHLVNSGGVLVDIIDRGIGMTEKEMAYANWQLEHPSASDINAPRWMGLLVVARLAARHGIRIRLQPAEFGGLAALVWLPDEVLTRQGAVASARPSGFGSPRFGPGSPEAAVDSGYATAEQRPTAASSMEFASSRGDVRHAPLGGRLIPDVARPPGSTRSVGVSGQEVTDLEGELAADIADGPFGTRPLAGPALSTPSGTKTSGLVSAAPGTAGSLSQETSSAAGGIIVPPVKGSAETSRLPILEEVESLWFRSGRRVPGLSGLTAAAGDRWSSAADEGWRAAETVDSPSSSGTTAAGLPRRLPNANLVPGAVQNTQPVPPNRSAAAARDRLAGFQRGVREGRAAYREAVNPAEADES